MAFIQSEQNRKHTDEEQLAPRQSTLMAPSSTKEGQLTHGDNNTPPNLSRSLTSEDCTVDTREVIKPEPNR